MYRSIFLGAVVAGMLILGSDSAPAAAEPAAALTLAPPKAGHALMPAGAPAGPGIRGPAGAKSPAWRYRV
ncbi:MAG: hypothetical protein WDN08_01740 [Rhizomicrobium sp.]